MYSKIKGIALEVTRSDIVSYTCVQSVPWLSTDGTIDQPSPTMLFFNSAYSLMDLFVCSFLISTIVNLLFSFGSQTFNTRS